MVLIPVPMFIFFAFAHVFYGQMLNAKRMQDRLYPHTAVSLWEFAWDQSSIKQSHIEIENRVQKGMGPLHAASATL